MWLVQIESKHNLTYIENCWKNFIRKQGKYFVKKLIRKIHRSVTKPVKFIVICQTKVSHFLSKKDKIPDLDRSNLFYQFSFPGCSESFIRKTMRNLGTGLAEHAKFGKLNWSAIGDILLHVNMPKIYLFCIINTTVVNGLKSDNPFTNEELGGGRTKAT